MLLLASGLTRLAGTPSSPYLRPRLMSSSVQAERDAGAHKTTHDYQFPLVTNRLTHFTKVATNKLFSGRELAHRASHY